MKKRIITFILVIVTIINIIAGAFIFVDIQIMQMPETTIKIDVLEMNSNEVVVQTTIDMYNPNGFNMIMKDFELITKDESGDIVSHTKIEGGVVSANEETSFTDTIVLDLKGNNPGLLKTKLTGTVGMNIIFIEKTTPMAVSIITSMEDVIEHLALPVINIKTEFEDITNEYINITGLIEIYNPNSIDIMTKDMSMEITTDDGKVVGSLIVNDSLIAGESTTKIDTKGQILLESMNAKKLIASMDATMIVKMANYSKSLPLSLNAEISVPDINEILGQDKPFDIFIWIDFKIGLRGMAGKVTLEIVNPTKLDFYLKDTSVTLYDIRNDEWIFVCDCDLDNSVAKAKENTYLKSDILIPISTYFPKFGQRILPDGIMVYVLTNITLNGIEQALWTGVGGYQDLRLFRFN